MRVQQSLRECGRTATPGPGTDTVEPLSDLHEDGDISRCHLASQKVFEPCGLIGRRMAA
jgi:hypothetical protein